MNQEHLRGIQVHNSDCLARIRAHPFIERAHAGGLSKEQVLRWIYCAGRESRSFPDVLVNMIERSTDEGVRSILEANLADEFGNGDPEHAHFRHYIYLLEKIGLSESTFVAYVERSGIRLALDLAYSVSEGEDVGIALGYMLVNEGMTPITYDAVDVALHRYFPNLQTEFFRLHVEVDAEHVAQLYEAITRMPEESLDSIQFGISIGERGMAILLDEALGIFEPPASSSTADMMPTAA